MQILTQYKCHKEVQASKINKIDRHSDLENYVLTLDDVSKGSNGIKVRILVPNNYVDKHKPSVGGYYIRYKDGYQSFSPAEPFESGYSKLTKLDKMSKWFVKIIKRTFNTNFR